MRFFRDHHIMSISHFFLGKATDFSLTVMTVTDYTIFRHSFWLLLPCSPRWIILLRCLLGSQRQSSKATCHSHLNCSFSLQPAWIRCRLTLYSEMLLKCHLLITYLKWHLSFPPTLPYIHLSIYYCQIYYTLLCLLLIFCPPLPSHWSLRSIKAQLLRPMTDKQCLSTVGAQ